MMAKLILWNDQEYPPESQCSECDVIFSVVWHRNPVYTRIEYCPFCGEEIEESEDAK